MLYLSEMLIRHHELQSFDELLILLDKTKKETNERFFRIDVKPTFFDTPENWEDRLEAAFY
ncbi:MAG: sulfur relay protein DsrC [Thiotrichaceae bacterium]|nr:sulfur relay protein DsrC [Thiotrichaceae bacterium]